jgi:hypothetical protein
MRETVVYQRRNEKGYGLGREGGRVARDHVGHGSDALGRSQFPVIGNDQHSRCKDISSSTVFPDAKVKGFMIVKSSRYARRNMPNLAMLCYAIQT